jgi:hypothetical protein
MGDHSGIKLQVKKIFNRNIIDLDKLKNSNEIIFDENLIAYCGLYCGACPRFLKGKCSGCKANIKSKWCKVKPCNIETGIKSCAECKKYVDVDICKSFNPIIIKVGEFVSKTSRKSGIQMIKEKGSSSFASYMAKNKLVSIKR